MACSPAPSAKKDWARRSAMPNPLKTTAGYLMNVGDLAAIKCDLLADRFMQEALSSKHLSVGWSMKRKGAEPKVRREIRRECLKRLNQSGVHDSEMQIS